MHFEIIFFIEKKEDVNRVSYIASSLILQSFFL